MVFTDVLTNPLMAAFVTLGSFLFAQYVQKHFDGHIHLNPAIMAIILVVTYIVVFDIPYETYLQDVNLIHGLLGPTTVALAIPLYNQLLPVEKSLAAIVGSVLVACLVAAGTGYYLANFMEATEDIQLAIIPKSVTTPIAIEISEKIGAQTPLTVFFVFTTGIIGSIIAPVIFKIFRIKDEKAIGLSLGATCHGLGVARAFEHSKKAGAFSALGMGLMGIVSGILLPLLVFGLIR